MLLLATDTSGKQGSIALADCGPDACRILEVTALAGGTFSAQLVPQIAAMLEKHGYDKADVGAFAVASGPGSFTGLRVGLAAIKALAEVLGKPIATVSLLEAVAVSSGISGRVMAALDAGRSQIFLGEYEVANSAARGIREQLVSRDEWLNSASQSVTVTPDACLADAARAKRLQVAEVRRPASDTIAHLGWKKIVSGQTVTADHLEPNYVRRLDAELLAKKS